MIYQRLKKRKNRLEKKVKKLIDTSTEETKSSYVIQIVKDELKNKDYTHLVKGQFPNQMRLLG